MELVDEFAELRAAAESETAAAWLDSVLAAAEPPGLLSPDERLLHSGKARRRLPNAISHELFAEAAADLRAARLEVGARANRSFVLVVVFGLTMFGALLVATVLASLGLLPGAIVGVLEGMASCTVASLFFRIYQRETKRADAIMRDLRRIEDLRLRLLVAGEAGPLAKDRNYSLKGQGYSVEIVESRPVNES